MDIVICVIALIIFLICAAVCVISYEPVAGLVFALFGIFTLVILVDLANQPEKNEDGAIIVDTENLHSATVYDIVDFQIDTNVVISGTDTTKTYTLTYWN